MRYDFSGWATRNNLKCSDGRVILKDAFKDNDGQTVPLVWNHQHNDPANVLGHALLENRNEGVYAYCTFNDTDMGIQGKQLVQHGDVTALSIYANRLTQRGGNVLHGAIREVSLVLAGANPGAYIDSVIAHSDGDEEEEAIIYTGEEIALYHGDSNYEQEEYDMARDDRTPAELIEEELTDEQKAAVYYMIGDAVDEALEEAGYADEYDEDEDEEYDEDVDDEYDEDENEEYDEDVDDEYDENEEYDEGDYEDMKHNVFDIDDDRSEDVLSHSEMDTIIGDAKMYGSMKESFLAHADEYGIQDIDYLFPEAHNLNNPPEFIKRDQTWVDVVMSGVHHSPFSRIKSMFADITEDEARAKGYLKGKLKKEEVFSLLKRVTTPTTVYKKQKMDRDDVIDITDFDVIAWLKTEMRMMLNEELARAFVFGDGRISSSDDKINEQNIRPIVSDAELYTIQYDITVANNATDDDIAKDIIKAAIKSRKDYRGSGNPIFFTSEEWLTNMLLLEDQIGRPLYKTEAELATKLRVSRIVAVPDEIMPANTYGVYVNLNDYNVGADKGGSVSMFDDFDIDYNQQKYLIETRCSGALTKPKSAVVIKKAS